MYRLSIIHLKYILLLIDGKPLTNCKHDTFSFMFILINASLHELHCCPHRGQTQTKNFSKFYLRSL